MKSEDLFDYVNNIIKFVTDKNLKRKYYKEAVEQIEAALKGQEDIASINYVAENRTEEGVNRTLEPETNQLKLEKTKNLQRKSSKAKNDDSVDSVRASKTTLKTNQESIDITDAVADAIVSRSGRKIKPKKFLDSDVDDVVLAKRKHSFESEGICPTKKTKEANSSKLNIDHLLKLESNLIELDHLIKASVGLNGAQPDKCIQHLNEFKQLNITPIMLKKHPNCVETMKRLRRYVGNVKAWDMDDTLKESFNQKAHQIRLQAEEIYNNFKYMFNFKPDTSSFWEFFMELVESFRQNTQHLTTEQMYDLLDEPKFK